MPNLLSTYFINDKTKSVTTLHLNGVGQTRGANKVYVAGENTGHLAKPCNHRNLKVGLISSLVPRRNTKEVAGKIAQNIFT